MYRSICISKWTVNNRRGRGLINYILHYSYLCGKILNISILDIYIQVYLYLFTTKLQLK